MALKSTMAPKIDHGTKAPLESTIRKRSVRSKGLCSFESALFVQSDRSNDGGAQRGVTCGGANMSCGGGIVVPLSDGALYECQRVYCYC